MTTKTLFAIATLLAAFQASAQDVRMKKGKVLIDGIESMDYTVDMTLAETHIYKLGTKDEVLLIDFNNNGTREYKPDDYITVYFTAVNAKLRTRSLFYGFKGEVVFKKLVTEGVVLGDGSIDEQKLDVFFGKYNEE